MQLSTRCQSERDLLGAGGTLAIFQVLTSEVVPKHLNNVSISQASFLALSRTIASR